jgi:nickel-dependent lactate racemase
MVAARTYAVAHGESLSPPFPLPAAWQVTVVEPPAPDAPGGRRGAHGAAPEAAGEPEAGPKGRLAAGDDDDDDDRIARALAGPIGTPPLRKLARGASRVVIAITDLTRPCPDHRLVPALLSELALAGVPRAAISLVVATGLHRGMRPAEIRARLGAGVPADVEVVNHDARDRAGLVDLAPLAAVGTAAAGGGPGGPVPVVLSRRVMDAGLVLATGLVEPHLYAGYSGGAKVVAIGCAGEQTIAATHGPAFLDHPGTRLGVLEGNPFAGAVSEIGERARVRFVLDVVLDAAGRIARAAAGEPRAVLAHVARHAAAAMLSPVDVSDGFDLAIAGVPHPKDCNFYQASRVPTYLQLGARPVVRPGGTIVIFARCPEGMGEGVGESRFARALAAMDDPAAYVASRRGAAFQGGEQRAYVMAKVLAQARVVLVGAARPDALALGPVACAPDLARALEMAGLSPSRPARVIIVPDPFRCLPAPAPAPAAVRAPIAADRPRPARPARQPRLAARRRGIVPRRRPEP